MHRDWIEGPLVVCSVLGAEDGKTPSMLSRAPSGCALIELRADRLGASEIRNLVRGCARALIVTIRRREHGGAFEGTEEEREEGLRAALEAGARFVDVEWDGPLARLADEPALRSRVILSHHGVACLPQELLRVYSAMCARAAAPLKIVASADGVDRLPNLRGLLARARGDGRVVSAFALGPVGTLSRLLAPSWGSWTTYGSLEAGAETGAGQYTAEEMLTELDVLGISARTRLFGLVGRRVAGSPSPAMHAAGYRRLGHDARYFAVETDSLERFVPLVDREAGIGLAGFAVTMPFKEQAAALCAPDDPTASATGAVNTVIVDGPQWRGYNTDGPGALDRIRARLDPKGTTVAVLGAGGTARAVAFELQAAGAEVTIFNRDPARGAAAARRVGAKAAPPEALGRLAWDILVHATPRGSDGERFLDPEGLCGSVVLDAVYASRPTALVSDARSRGLEVIDGAELLAAQGIRQFRLMTGSAVPFRLFHAAAAQRLSSRGA